uniref:Lipocalin-like domain-containing protein n=1 Tax=Colletotrichum fructicola (strain Nara gc5) TaxID=1213859 RepID=L2FJE5_COLFN
MRPSTLPTLLSCAAVATAHLRDDDPERRARRLGRGMLLPHAGLRVRSRELSRPLVPGRRNRCALHGRVQVHFCAVLSQRSPLTFAPQDNGTVLVNNTCQADTTPVNILGTAAPADPSYGAKGVLRVQFPGQPAPSCDIVQDYTPDFAVVQAYNFSTLFVLSREQNPADELLDTWIARAGQLGSNLDNVVKTDQTGCLFT